jgi:hypothetical protein
MKRFCVFCGQPPVDKTKEHVLPQWLIELTGDPARQAYFGYAWEEKPRRRRFAFNAFAFPACEGCNAEFSGLEAQARPAMLAVLEGRALGAADISLLLDWFDKVRVGLWLSIEYLDQNASGIIPRFYIKQRLRTRDRMLQIYQLDCRERGLAFTGTFGRSFSYSPVAFALRVNDLCFLNASTIGLCSRRLGFPFVHRKEWQEDGRLACYVQEGLQRVMRPVLRGRAFPPGGISLFQPLLDPGDAREFYLEPYVNERCIDATTGIGGIYTESVTREGWLKTDERIALNPGPRLETDAFMKRICLSVMKFQVKDFEEFLSVDSMPSEVRRKYARTLTRTKQLNGVLARAIQRGSV